MPPFAIRMAEAPKPEPRPARCWSRVDAAGLCAGDLYIYLGKNPYVTYPRDRRPRDRRHGRGLGPDTAGPADRHARGGRTLHRLRPVLSVPDRQAQLLRQADDHRRASRRRLRRLRRRARSSNLHHRARRAVAPSRRAFAEPVAIGVQACRRGAVTAGDTVLVLGAGPIGLALVEVARARGARVFATDIVDRAASHTAAELGASRYTGRRRTSRRGAAHHRRRRHAGRHRGDRQRRRRWSQTVDLVAAGGRIVIVGLVKKGQGITFRASTSPARR